MEIESNSLEVNDNNLNSELGSVLKPGVKNFRLTDRDLDIFGLF